MTDSGMSLRFELFVHDLHASTDFYSRVLGFSVMRNEEDYVSLQNGTVVIGLGPAEWLPRDHHFRPDIGTVRSGIGVEVVLEVSDVEAAQQRAIDAGCKVLVPLGMRSWGLSDFRIADPDGYYLRITSRA
jgi:predicted enzyme related to lactoylglutathione lyase